MAYTYTDTHTCKCGCTSIDNPMIGSSISITKPNQTKPIKPFYRLDNLETINQYTCLLLNVIQLHTQTLYEEKLICEL